MTTVENQPGVIPPTLGKTNFTMIKKCEICGRKEFSQTRMWHFPENKDQCRLWLKNVGNEDLVYIPIEKLHMKLVCDDHFIPEDYIDITHELKESAIPMTGLTREPLPDEIFAEFPYHLANLDTNQNHGVEDGKTSSDGVCTTSFSLQSNQSGESYYNNLHQDLETCWSKILCQGLPLDIKTSILKKYRIPANCKLLTAPSFNPRITNILPKSTKIRDELVKNNQQQLSVGIAGIGKVLSTLFSDENQKDSEAKLILADACQILTDLHYIMSQQRISMLTGNENFTITADVKGK